MGATVVTGKNVAAFRDPKTGAVIYLLFEETYEKNLHPHIPSWGCRAIGTYDQVLKRVFAAAAVCEGGMLQTRSGATKPETYIKSWTHSFAKPIQMEDRKITLKLGGGSMFDTIPDTHVETAIAVLERLGRQDIVEALKAGPTKVNLHRDADVIINLYSLGTGLPVWKVIRELSGQGCRDESLAPKVAKRATVAPSALAFAVDRENVVVSLAGGPLKHMGWRYSAVGKFITDVACPIELESSGSACKLIGEFRNVCNDAPELPADTVITVMPARADYEHHIKSARELAVKLGLYPSRDAVPDSYETTFGAVQEIGEDYLLSTLQEGQLALTLAPGREGAPEHGREPADHNLQPQLF